MQLNSDFLIPDSHRYNKLRKRLNLLFLFIVVIFVAKICNSIFGQGQATLEEITSDDLNGIEVKIILDDLK